MSQGSEYAKRLMRAKKDYINAYKAARGCCWCGETDAVVLDLDHTDPATKSDRLRPYITKRGRIRRLDWHQFGWNTLNEELKKCQVLCSNYHRRKTHAETLKGITRPAPRTSRKG